MKVAYFIYTMHTGVGGHYFSLSSIANEIANKIDDFFVVNIGFDASEVLNKEINRSIYNVKDFLLPNPLTLLHIIKLLKKEKCNIIHCFDDNSFFYARIASQFLNIPIVLTKCGGPNPKLYYPQSNAVTVFSQEDKQYFNSRDRDVSLIANRVGSTPFKSSYLQSSKKSDLSGKVILCISRISTAYENKIKQSIIFSRKLREHGITNTLIIIGVIEDPNVYVKLIEFSRFDNIMLLTEPTYTTKASEFIHYADLVVGTGRGFMEAALQGKLMLCPDNANKRLAFIDDSNIDLFFSRNFSGRYEADNDNFTSLIDILMNGDTDYKKMIIGYSDSKFSLRVGSEKYVQLYLDKPMNKLMIYDLCKHFVFFFYAKANKGGKVSAFKKMLLGK